MMLLIERGVSSTSYGDAATICGCNCCFIGFMRQPRRLGGAVAGGVIRHLTEALLDETRDDRRCRT